MESSATWFTAVFVLLLILGFIVGISSVFKKLEAGEPVFSFTKPSFQETKNLTPDSPFIYPLVP